MKKYKHIGWVKYCCTLTALPLEEEEEPVFVQPWLCRSTFFKEKPELEHNENPSQFFWKKMYAS